MRLGTRFLLIFLALSLGPLLAVFVLAYANGRRTIEESLGRLFEFKATQAIGALDHEVARLQSTGRAWAALEWMQDVLTDDVDGRVTTFLIQQPRQQPLLAGARVTNAVGTVIAASRPEWVGELARAPAESEPDTCEDAVDGGGAPSPLITCRHPIRASFDETRVLGELLVSWDLSALFRNTQGSPGLETAPGELLLLRRDGRVALDPARLVGLGPGTRPSEAGSKAAARAAAGGRGYLLDSVGGEEQLVGFDHSHGASGWSALVLQDAARAFAPVHRLRRIVIGGGTLLAIAVVALSFVFSRRLTGPLLEVEAAARRVASGDLSVRIESRSSDELGSLAASFDRMVGELSEQRAQLVDKDYLDSLLANMIDGLLVIDSRGMVERVNPGLLALVGREEEELFGTQAAALFAEGKVELESRVLEPARRSGAAREVEMLLVERSGALIPVSLSAGRLPDQGDSEASIVCIATDVRRRKSTEHALVQAREEAEASSRARADFLATISHEIRTPLHGILGVADLMTGRRLGPMPPEYVERLQRSTDALLAVVNQVLDFSKLDAGKMTLEPREFALRGCVESVSEILSAQAREKDIELVTVVDDALPARVRGDEGRLRQVLLNLGGNAIAATRRGEVVIRASRGAPGTSQVLLEVSDTGVGIPESARDRLFQPFAQLDTTSTRRREGAGLGLAISRQLVELMGGEIAVESEVGKGSTFRFSVELEALHEPQAEAVEPVTLEGRRVLVVDDNATNRFVAREMLTGLGASVTEASDAWEALERLQATGEEEAPFDLALIDFQMPEMDGAQLATQIRKDPRLAALPLVLLTSVPQHGEAVRMMRLGLDAYLTKPVRQQQLRDTVAAVLRRRELRHRSR